MGEHYARALVRASFGLWCCHHWGRTVEPMLLGVDRKNPLVRLSPTSLRKLCPERWLRAVVSLACGVAGAVSPAQDHRGESLAARGEHGQPRAGTRPQPRQARARQRPRTYTPHDMHHTITRLLLFSIRVTLPCWAVAVRCFCRRAMLSRGVGIAAG